MNLTESLEKIKAELLHKARLNDMLDPEIEKKKRERIAKGLSDVPVNQMIEQVLYIDENLLKRIEKKGGKESADYAFFAEVRRSLLWAIVLSDRYDSLNARYTSLKVQEMLCRENLELFARELQKFQTLEEIFLTNALDSVAQGVKNRVDGLLQRPK